MSKVHFSPAAICRPARRAVCSSLRSAYTPPLHPNFALHRSLPTVYAPVHAAVFRALYLRGATTVACPVASLGLLLQEQRIEW